MVDDQLDLSPHCTATCVRSSVAHHQVSSNATECRLATQHVGRQMSLDTGTHDKISVSAVNGSPAERREAPAATERPGAGNVLRGARQARFADQFANVIAVLMRDPNFRNVRLADLEWMVIPPVMSGQYQLARAAVPTVASAAQDKQKNDVMVPVAVVLWASVSAEIDARLSGSLDKPVELRTTEWASGDNIWLMAIAGDPRAIPTFLGQLETREFKGKTVKLRARSADGKTEILPLDVFRRRKSDELRQTSGKN